MKKFFGLILLLFVSMLFYGCSNTDTKDDTDKDTNEENTDVTDAVSSASIVATKEGFKTAISSDGTWIICLTKDLTFDEDLLVEGEFKNGKQDDSGNDVYQRKLALYSQDENRTITDRYTLTAPKMTITSPQASIQHGTFKGDLYVSVDNFQLVDATVDGNVYFSTEEAQNTFSMDETSEITGTQGMQ